MEKESKLKQVLTPTFLIAAAIALLMAVLSLVSPTVLSDVMSVFQTVFGTEYGFFAQMIPFLCMVVLLYLAFSKKYSHIIIGGQKAKTQYSMFSWLGMLFTSSIGMGLIAFAVNEPLYAYLLSPAAVDAGSEMAAAREAMATSMYHWGVSVWAIFALSGLVVAYFVARHKARYLPGDSITKAWPHKKWSSKLGTFVNVLACICAATTISASMGLGVVQLSNGIGALWGLSPEVTAVLPYAALALLAVVCILACSTKTVGKGMNMISNLNMYLCIFVLVFAIVCGPTRYIFEQTVQTFGDYVMALIPRSFQMFLFGTDPGLTGAMGSVMPPYVTSWDVVNNMFWISWAPFMSVFIASISKGRTLRQYALATLTVPTLFMLLWNSTFGGISILNMISGDGSVAANVLSNPDMTFFSILKTLPLAQMMTIVTVVLLFFFLATTVTSAALSLGRMTDRHGMTSAPIRCIVWVVLMSAIALTSLVAAAGGGQGALTTIKSIGSTFGYPYLFFFVLTTVAFLRRLFLDEKNAPTLRPGDPSSEIAALKKQLALLEQARAQSPCKEVL